MCGRFPYPYAAAMSGTCGPALTTLIDDPDVAVDQKSPVGPARRRPGSRTHLPSDRIDKRSDLSLPSVTFADALGQVGSGHVVHVLAVALSFGFPLICLGSFLMSPFSTRALRQDGLRDRLCRRRTEAVTCALHDGSQTLVGAITNPAWNSKRSPPLVQPRTLRPNPAPGPSPCPSRGRNGMRRAVRPQGLVVVWSAPIWSMAERERMRLPSTTPSPVKTIASRAMSFARLTEVHLWRRGWAPGKAGPHRLESRARTFPGTGRDVG